LFWENEKKWGKMLFFLQKPCVCIWINEKVPSSSWGKEAVEVLVIIVPIEEVRVSIEVIDVVAEVREEVIVIINTVGVNIEIVLIIWDIWDVLIIINESWGVINDCWSILGWIIIGEKILIILILIIYVILIIIYGILIIIIIIIIIIISNQTTQKSIQRVNSVGKG